jgi:hypothetical protein
MSERSERIMETAFFAAQRRGAHWCAAETQTPSTSHDLVVHQ